MLTIPKKFAERPLLNLATHFSPLSPVLLSRLTMPYQYKRQPLTQDEANRLVCAYQSDIERLVVRNVLDTGLRISGLANFAG